MNDEVLLMSDESEISSLNEEEVEQVKKVYEKVSIALQTHRYVQIT